MLLGMERNVIVGTEPRASEFRRDAKQPHIGKNGEDQEDFAATESAGVVVVGRRKVHSERRRGRRRRAGEYGADGMEGSGRWRHHSWGVRREDFRGVGGETGHGRE